MAEEWSEDETDASIEGVSPVVKNKISHGSNNDMSHGSNNDIINSIHNINNINNSMNSNIISNGLQKRRIFRNHPSTSINAESALRKPTTHVALKNDKVTMDIETGKAGSRVWLVEEIHRRKEAMNPTRRRQQEWMDTLKGINKHDQDSSLPPQYRLRTTTKIYDGNKYNIWLLLERFYLLASNNDTSPLSDGASGITRFLNWTFRTSFSVLIFVQALSFWIATATWAFIIWIIGKFDPECITVAGQPYDQNFVDAYALSWTTFSTVGYGVVYPTLSVADGPACIGINVMMSLEAFMGVLFAAVMGAVVFGKVCRIQSHADVIFSDPILVRFGAGITDLHDEEEEVVPSTTPTTGGEKEAPHPFPVFEFRIINTMHSTQGGEIMNAFINCTAKINESSWNSDVPRKTKSRRKAGKKSAARNNIEQETKKTPPEPTKPKVVKPNIASRWTEIPSHFKSALRTNEKKTTIALLNDLQPDTATMKECIGDSAQQKESLCESDSLTGANTPSHSTVDSEPKTTDGQKSQVVPVPAVAKGTPLRRLQKVAKTLSNSRGATLFNQMMYPSQDSNGYDPDDNESSGNDFSADDGRRNRRRRLSFIDEDLGFTQSCVFAPLDLETPSHPFFRRVWVVRHVLNEDSPLLSAYARNLIRENHGNWPEVLNNGKAIRDNVDFNEIIVSFSGTANATGSAVYNQTIYENTDMAIGYMFANVLAKNANGELVVADDLIDHVLVQPCGGALVVGDEVEGEAEGTGFFSALGESVGLGSVDRILSPMSSRWTNNLLFRGSTRNQDVD